MKKNIQKVLSSKDIDIILELAIKNDLEVVQYAGALLDNYIIYNENTIKIGRCVRTYIIIKEEYLNEWTSQSVVILTDNLKEVEKNKKIFE